MTRFTTPLALLFAVAGTAATPTDAAAQFFRPSPFGATSQQFHFRTYGGFYSTPFGSIGFQYQRVTRSAYAVPFFGGAGYPALSTRLPFGA
jgi:hypothetical protein